MTLRLIYLWLGLRINMFVTSDATKEQFTTRKLFTQANIQGDFRVIHMKTYSKIILKENWLIASVPTDE